jgi:hypothetical protein
MRRALLWLPVLVLVVGATRTLAYALAPTPTPLTLALQREVGGPRLVVTTFVALGLAIGASSAFLWLASMAVRERHIARGRSGVPPSLRIRTVGRRALVLWAAAAVGFTAVESFVHWRAGLGLHGVHCLLGPAHRDVVPLLAALSLIAAACHGALEHLLGWMRRTLLLLLRRRAPAATWTGFVQQTLVPQIARLLLAGPHSPRGPPICISV